MTHPLLRVEISDSERTPKRELAAPGANRSSILVIAKLEEEVNQLKAKVGSLDEQLLAAKNIVGEAANSTKQVEPRRKAAPVRRKTTRLGQTQLS